jgi:replication-associated recombination protein RarA
LCGPPITGKSTIWIVVAKTINSTILNSSFNNNNNKDSVRN